MLLANDLVIQE